MYPPERAGGGGKKGGKKGGKERGERKCVALPFSTLLRFRQFLINSLFLYICLLFRTFHINGIIMCDLLYLASALNSVFF